MRHDPRTVQQWAAIVLKNPHWDIVENGIRNRYVRAVIELSTNPGISDIKDRVSLVDDVVRKLIALEDMLSEMRALAVDTSASTDFFDEATENAE